jgi:uncharacterized phage infection (PIP) family protein YhgE
LKIYCEDLEEKNR